MITVVGDTIESLKFDYWEGHLWPWQPDKCRVMEMNAPERMKENPEDSPISGFSS